MPHVVCVPVPSRTRWLEQCLGAASPADAAASGPPPVAGSPTGSTSADPATKVGRHKRAAADDEPTLAADL